MTTVAHAAQLLADGLKLVENVDAPFRDKAARVRIAEDTITGALGFLREVIEAHPEECAGHWPAGTIHPVDLAAIEAAVEARLVELTRDVAEDEIDEDPPVEVPTHPAIEAAFQRGYSSGQHDKLEALAGPSPQAAASPDQTGTVPPSKP